LGVVVGDCQELLGRKTPTYPAVLRGRTTSPKGGTFVTTLLPPFEKGSWSSRFIGIEGFIYIPLDYGVLRNEQGRCLLAFNKSPLIPLIKGDVC